LNPNDCLISVLLRNPHGMNLGFSAKRANERCNGSAVSMGVVKISFVLVFTPLSPNTAPFRLPSLETGMLSIHSRIDDAYSD